MMTPVIALVGRPNVGKSTLFNQLTKSRNAIVANLSGLTRDRQYGEGCIHDQPFIVIDTGGISGDEKGIDAVMAAQSLIAIDEANIVLFLVDGRSGLTVADEMIARHLRINSKNVKLIVNKIDGIDADQAESEFTRLGMGHAFRIAASHGRGVYNMIETTLREHCEAHIPLNEEPALDDSSNVHSKQGIKISIVGRPNVGKSTLVNRMLGEERVIVYDQAGTTRDSIYIPYMRNDQQYTLIDTAGVRRKSKISATVEKFSVVKTLQAIKDAHVVIMLFDAKESIVDQDLHLLGFIIDSGRAVVLAINKWDGMQEDEKQQVKNDLQRRLNFIKFANLHLISAKYGTGVGHLYESVNEAFHSATRKLSTNKLTRILQDCTMVNQPPLVNGRRIKLRYCHAGGSNPPTLIIHGNQTESVPRHYRLYLENTYRKLLKLTGTPIKIEFKSSDNPYQGKKNDLTSRQIKKKQRLMDHTRKAKKKNKK